MTQEQQHCRGNPKLTNCDAYFDDIQSRKKLPLSSQQNLTTAFAVVPASALPHVPGGKVIEIMADTSIADALKTLTDHHIFAAPVTNPDAGPSLDWRERYLGIVDYPDIILWVLETAEDADFSLSTNKQTSVSTGAVGALGAMAMGITGSTAVAGLTVAAVGAAVTSGMAAEKDAAKDDPSEADKKDDDFYNIILQEEPFKLTKVRSILKSYCWAPFLPVTTKSSMLSVLLLLSKYGMRNVPVIEPGCPYINNFITQTSVVEGLESCKGQDWFDGIAMHPIADLGLPFMSCTEVIAIRSNDLVLEAFKRMRDNKIGGLPVVEGPKRKIIGNVSIGDIRYLLLKYELFSNFKKLTVNDFLNSISSTGSESEKVVPPITCAIDSTLGSVIHTLATKSVHRVYVVAGEDEVIGVITLRDVITCFVYEPPDHFDNYLDSMVKKTLSQ